MTLNIGGTSNSKPYFKYSAKSDKWFVRGADGQDKEIERPTFAADLANIETGWLRFREGQPPERVMDPSLQQARSVSGRRIQARLCAASVSARSISDGVAEIASTSIHLSNVIKEIYEQFYAGKGRPSGQGSRPFLYRVRRP